MHISFSLQLMVWLCKRMNYIMTVLIILLLVSSLVFLPMFFLFKFHGETNRLIQYTSSMWDDKG